MHRSSLDRWGEKVIPDRQSPMRRNRDLEETRYLNVTGGAWEIKPKMGEPDKNLMCQTKQYRSWGVIKEYLVMIPQSDTGNKEEEGALRATKDFDGQIW